MQILKPYIKHLTGPLCLLISVLQTFIYEQPHFYTLFSIGFYLIFLDLYEVMTRKKFFHGWGRKEKWLYYIVLFAASVFTDFCGIKLGYWIYPHYTQVDTFLKYVFEWTIALSYHLVSLMVGIEFFKRLKLSESVSFFLSLFVIVTLVGFITETFNIFVYSWRVISMPFSNYMIVPYFLVFQTIGYWLMAIIPWLIYIIIFKKDTERKEPVTDKH